MSKIVRRARFLDVAEIGRNESWLTDMAAEGFHLKKLGNMFATFEQGEPRQVRYRIDYSYSKNEPEVQKELYAECGWDFVCECGPMSVYRSDESQNAAEPHTDPAEQAYTLEALGRKLVVSSVIVTLLTVAAMCMIIFAAFIGKTPLLTFVEGSNVTMPILAVIYAYMIYQSVRTAVSIKRLLRSLREGKEINHSEDWRGRYRFYRIISPTIIVIALLSIALPVTQLALQSTETLPVENDNQMYLRLADIENNPALRHITRYEDDGIDWSNNVRSQWSPYAPVMLEIHEEGVVPGKLWEDESGEYSPSISYKLYKLRFPGMSEGVINDLRKRYEPYNQEPLVDETANPAYPGFDRLLVLSEETRSEIIAWKGGVVIRFVYFGEKSLDDAIQAVSEYLNRL